jgi:putative endonuclease
VALTRADRRRSLWAGHGAEWAAEIYLRAKGYRILARRYLVKGGEIDIIARRGETIAFVEVKLRGSIEAAQTSIGADKRRRMARAVRTYLSGNEAAMRMVLRADAVYLAPWHWPLHVENAFELNLG